MVYGGVKGMVTFLVGLICLFIGSMIGVFVMCLMIVGGSDDEFGGNSNNEDRQDKEG